MSNPAQLEARVAALEGLVEELLSVLRKHVGRVAQPDLLPPTPAPDPGASLVALRDALVATFERVTGRKYVFEGVKDAQAVKRLNAVVTTGGLGIVAMCDRFEECLRMPSYPGSTSIAVFAMRLNSFGTKVVAPALYPATKEDPYAP